MPRKREKVWIQPFLPCSGLLAQSIPGMHVHAGLAGLDLDEGYGGRSSCGFVFSQIRNRAPRAEVKSTVPRHRPNQGVQGPTWEQPWTSATA